MSVTAAGEGAAFEDLSVQATRPWRVDDLLAAEPMRLPRRGARATLEGLDQAGLQARARGKARLYFTSSRVFPPEVTGLYPYSAVVKVFFRIGSQGGFFCSGSVISPRLVLTAGHCAFSPPSSRHTDFRVVPAFDRGGMPFGSWQAEAVFVSSAWTTGSGEVPNPADWALLVIADRTGERIGDVTGWLGWETGELAMNHVNILGYPGNLDDGEWMHSVASSDRVSAGLNNHEYGSDMLHGSSGSPWIQNFGEGADGQGRFTKAKKLNRVVGVTSYGRGRSGLFNGASELDESFEELVDEACAHAPGTCEARARPQLPKN